MKLADKIIQERKKMSWSQEELAERLDVSRQSVSKWEGGLSIPELDKIIAMSELFGVSTDYLLKESIEDAVGAEKSSFEDAPNSEAKQPRRVLDDAFVDTYLATVKKTAPRIALGVMLCILSPITLICLGGVADLMGFMSENLAAGIGMLVLLGFVGGALALFIPAGMRLSSYEFLEREPFLLEMGIEPRIRELNDRYAHRHRMLVTVGVLLIVLGVVPLVTIALITQDELWSVLSVGILLLFAAIGVAILVYSSNISESYCKLLQIGEYSKLRKPFADVISSVYWGVTTVIYLGLSFLTHAWHITWIIWVLAGVLAPLIEVWTGKHENP